MSSISGQSRGVAAFWAAAAPAARTGLEAGHSGRAVRLRLAFQFGNPPLQPYNHHLQLGNDRLLLHDDGDENIATGGGQVNFGIHSLYMT